MSSQPIRQDTLDSLQQWMTSPDIQVAHHDCGIKALPAQTDTVSQRGCKSQSYTSWAWLPHSFILGGQFKAGSESNTNQDSSPSRKEAGEVVVARHITPELWRQLGKNVHNRYQNQRVMFDVATSGIITAKEIATRYSISTDTINYVFENNLDLKIPGPDPEEQKQKTDLMKTLRNTITEKKAGGKPVQKQKGNKNTPAKKQPPVDVKAGGDGFGSIADGFKSPEDSTSESELPDHAFPLNKQGHASAATEDELLATALATVATINKAIKDIDVPRVLCKHGHRKTQWKTSSDMHTYGSQTIQSMTDIEEIVLVKLVRLSMIEQLVDWLASEKMKFHDPRLGGLAENLAQEYLVLMANELDISLSDFEAINPRKRQTAGHKPNTNKQNIDTSPWNVDQVPVRSVQSTSSIVANLDPEFAGSPETYTTSLYNALMTKLNDPISANPLGSMVRGPNIVDYNSLLVLVKQMASRTSCIHDSTPLIRALCIATALNVNLANADPVPYQFITRSGRSNDRDIFLHITPFPNEQLGPIQIITMDWVTFTKFISRQIDPFPGILSPSGIDQSWAVVPVLAHQLTSSSLLLYIMSFLSSKFWNGTISAETMISIPTFYRDGKPRITQDYLSRTMPPTSSVHIPGPSNAILVVIDWPSAQNTPPIRLGNGMIIPTYIPGADIQPANIIDAWRWYWTSAHKNTIRSDSLVVVNELSQHGCTKFAVDRARTIVSDIYSTLRLDIGLPPRTRDSVFDTAENRDLTEYSRSLALKGAVVSAVQESAAEADLIPIYEGQPWLSTSISLNDKDALAISATGFNFAALGASHGGVKNSANTLVVANGRIRWASPHPKSNSLDYNSMHVSSLTRIAIRLGLYQISAPGKLFSHYEAIGQWIHLNSVAIAAATSVALSTNGKPTSEFSGWQVSSELADREAEMRQLVSSTTAGIRSWSQLRYEEIYSDGEIVDAIRSRYLMDSLWSSKDWYSFSPVPIFMWSQWTEKKHPNLTPQSPLKYVTTNIAGQTCRALAAHQHDDPLSLIRATVSIDVARYVPIILSREASATNQPVYVYWTSPTAHLCGEVTEKTTVPDYRFLSSNVPNYRVQNLALGYIEDTPVYVKDSNSALASSDSFIVKTSPLLYPDPPLSGNDQRPLLPIDEPAVTPSTDAMDAVQSQSAGTGTMQ